MEAAPTMRERTILPFREDPSQEVAPRLPGLEFRTARKARRARKEADARGIEQAREHLGTPAALTTQAVYHWDREDQLGALIEARQGEPEIGFMARLLALCALPRTNPGNRVRYVRRNGPYTLVMTSTGTTAKLPYGILPRLLLAWTCTEAVRTRSRTLTLGASLSAFMRKLGIMNHSGGSRGDRTRLQDQMSRLFNTAVQLSYEDAGRSASVGSLVADRTDFWWNPRHPDDPVLWESTIRLGEEFYNELIACPVPLDLHILKALKRSSLGVDLYLWLTYRTFALQRPLRLKWRQLYRQFGASETQDKLTVNAFRRDCLRELKKIKTAWPELTYCLPSGALELRPTPPRIPAVRADSVGS